jgi:internalin A
MEIDALAIFGTRTMTKHYAFWAVLLVLGMTSGSTECGEEKAIALLTKFRYRFVRDEDQPGKPVIEVRIVGRQVEDEVFKQLPTLKELRSLRICTYGSNVDLALTGLKDMKKLRRLNLEMCDLTDFSTKQIGMATGLRDVNIRYTRTTDAMLKELGGLKQLQKLYVSSLKVTDEGIKALAGLTQLEVLDLSDTKLTDAGLKELTGLKQLQELVLSETAITDAGLKNLFPLTRLQSLDLSQTKVTKAGVAAIRKALPKCEVLY